MSKQLNLVKEIESDAKFTQNQNAEFKEQDPQEHDLNKQEQALAQAIQTCLATEWAFKLYSYRIIPPKELIQLVANAYEKSNP